MTSSQAAPSPTLRRRQVFEDTKKEEAPANTATSGTDGKRIFAKMSFDWRSYLTKRNIAIAVGVAGLIAAGIYFVPQLLAGVGTASKEILVTEAAKNLSTQTIRTAANLSTETTSTAATVAAKLVKPFIQEFVQPIVGTVESAFFEAMRLAKFDLPIISPDAISCVKDLMPNITDMAKFQYPVSAFMNSTHGNSCLFMKLMNVASEKVTTVVLYGQENLWSFGNLATNTSVTFRSNDVLAISSLWQGRVTELSTYYPVEPEAVQQLYKLVTSAAT